MSVCPPVYLCVHLQCVASPMGGAKHISCTAQLPLGRGPCCQLWLLLLSGLTKWLHPNLFSNCSVRQAWGCEDLLSVGIISLAAFVWCPPPGSPSLAKVSQQTSNSDVCSRQSSPVTARPEIEQLSWRRLRAILLDTQTQSNGHFAWRLVVRRPMCSLPCLDRQVYGLIIGIWSFYVTANSIWITALVCLSLSVSLSIGCFLSCIGQASGLNQNRRGINCSICL